jgi:hypothetical protein
MRTHAQSPSAAAHVCNACLEPNLALSRSVSSDLFSNNGLAVRDRVRRLFGRPQPATSIQVHFKRPTIRVPPERRLLLQRGYPRELTTTWRATLTQVAIRDRPDDYPESVSRAWGSNG